MASSARRRVIMLSRSFGVVLLAASAAVALCNVSVHAADRPMKRQISYQNQQDLFYNFQEGPDPSGAAAQMYVSPRPVPPHVGWTYTTYQPFMPHEYLYRHTRSHYTHHDCSGWTRSKIRYRSRGLWIDELIESIGGPMFP
jgi:hypothetical protein